MWSTKVHGKAFVSKLHAHTEWTNFLRPAKQRCFCNWNRAKTDMTMPHDGATEQSPLSVQCFLNHFVLDSWETLFLQTSVLDTQVTVSTRVYYVHSIRLTSVSGCEFCGTSSFQHCSTAFKIRRFEAVTSCASFPPALLGSKQSNSNMLMKLYHAMSGCTSIY